MLFCGGGEREEEMGGVVRVCGRPREGVIFVDGEIV